MSKNRLAMLAIIMTVLSLGCGSKNEEIDLKKGGSPTSGCTSNCGSSGSTPSGTTTPTPAPPANAYFGEFVFTSPSSKSGFGQYIGQGVSGQFALGSTISFVQSAMGVAGCFVGVGPSTRLDVKGAGDEWNPSKVYLGALTSHAASDSAYFNSSAGTSFAASQLLSFREKLAPNRPSNAFYWRWGGTNSYVVDPPTAQNSDPNIGAIWCVYMAKNGFAETYAMNMSGSGTWTPIPAQPSNDKGLKLGDFTRPIFATLIDHPTDNSGINSEDIYFPVNQSDDN